MIQFNWRNRLWLDQMKWSWRERLPAEVRRAGNRRLEREVREFVHWVISWPESKSGTSSGAGKVAIGADQSRDQFTHFQWILQV